MIAVALCVVAAPGKRTELLAAVREGLLGPTRNEPGCIRYRFYQDVEDENAFSFVEEWESWDALNAHIRSDHVGRFLAELGDRIAEHGDQRVAARTGHGHGHSLHELDLVRAALDPYELAHGTRWSRFRWPRAAESPILGPCRTACPGSGRPRTRWTSGSTSSPR